MQFHARKQRSYIDPNPQQIPNCATHECLCCNDGSKSRDWISALLPHDVAGNNSGTMNCWIKPLTGRMVSMIWPNWHFTKLATGSELKSSSQTQRLSSRDGLSTAFSSVHTKSVAFQRDTCPPTGDYLKIITLLSVVFMSIKYPLLGIINDWSLSGGFSTT